MGRKSRKILFVTTVSSTIRAFLLPYADYFRRKGWEVHALSKEIENCRVCQRSFDRVFEIDWSRNPLELSNFFSLISRIRNIENTEKYDIVHVHTPVAAFLTRLALHKIRCQNGNYPKVFYTAHGFHFFRCRSFIENWFFLFLEKLAGSWTDYLIVINREDEETAKRFSMVPNSRIIWISGIGLDLKHFQPETEFSLSETASAEELNFEPGEKFFLSIGELNFGKRHEDSISAFSKLNSTDCKLFIIGEGALRKRLEELRLEKNLTDKVKILNYRNDIRPFLKNALALIISSEREGLPRIIMEAQALGTPVIGANVRGIKDLLDGGAGFLFPLGNVDALAGLIKRILCRPESVENVKEKAFLRIHQYDVSKMVEYHEVLYKKALGEP
ncbi:MAG: glycosyltransferase [Candidatus Riflebacteria bacterium]|nr:glycosyltransferase [Candidatus Riflebacteria bacterium]